MIAPALVFCAMLIGSIGLALAWKSGDTGEVAYGYLALIMLIICVIASIIAGAA